MLPADAAEDWPRPRSAPVFLPWSGTAGWPQPGGWHSQTRRGSTTMPPRR